MLSFDAKFPDELFQGIPLAALVVFTLLLMIALRLLFTSCGTRRLPPGPWGLPIVGYLPFIDADSPYKTLDRLAKKYGDIYSVDFGSVRAVVIAEPKLIRQALAKEGMTGRPPLTVTHGIMNGFGILGAEGNWWKEQRRFLMDTLHALGINRQNGVREKLEETISKEVEVCLQNFEKYDGQPFDCHELLGKTFGNIVCHVIFGHGFAMDDAQFQRQLELVDNGFRMVNIMGTMNFLPFLKHIPYFKRKYNEVLEGKKEHHTFIREQVSIHESQLDPIKPGDYVDYFLLQKKKQEDGTGTQTFIDEQLLHVVADLFGAGLETSKVTFEWFLLFMVTYPEVQRRIQDELDWTVPRTRLPSLNDLRVLSFTEAAILETQRLANLVPLGAPHGTTKDTELEGYYIPKGTMIIALLWSVHMNPDLWNEPSKFDPTRFLDAQGKVNKPQHFMPFSVGRRMCPGDDLARMELFLMVTSLLQRFTLLPPEEGIAMDLTPQMGFTLTPKPYKIRAVLRE